MYNKYVYVFTIIFNLKCSIKNINYVKTFLWKGNQQTE